MKTLDILSNMQVSAPCPASWSAMTGDDRARLCSMCDKHVYNISEMTSVEVVELIQKTQGSFCGKLYHRRDGNVLTADCPIGRRAFRDGRLKRVLTYSVIAFGFVTTGAFLKAANSGKITAPPTGPGVTFGDWKDWALQTLGFRGMANCRPSGQTMGVMLMPPSQLGEPKSADPL